MKNGMSMKNKYHILVAWVTWHSLSFQLCIHNVPSSQPLPSLNQFFKQEYVILNAFSYCSNKSYVIGTQKTISIRQKDMYRLSDGSENNKHDKMCLTSYYIQIVELFLSDGTLKFTMTSLFLGQAFS